MEIYERLAIARERKYPSAAQAAKAMGVAYGTYACHEGGVRGIKKDALERYAKFFGVPLLWLEHGIGGINEADQKNMDDLWKSATPDQRKQILDIAKVVLGKV